MSRSRQWQPSLDTLWYEHGTHTMGVGCGAGCAGHSEGSRLKLPRPDPRPHTLSQPPPNSQMCQDMAISFSFFYPGGRTIDPAVLKRSLQCVLGEVPHVAGRGRLLGYGSRLVDSVVECCNAGAEFATAGAPNIRRVLLLVHA